MMTNLSGTNLNNGAAVGSQSEGMESPSNALAAMPKYDAYKDSGVEWLGTIPCDWDTRRVKFVFSEANERSKNGSEELLSVSQYTGVTRKADKLAENDLLTNAETLEGYKKVIQGELVSNIMLAWNGSLGFSPFDGIVSPAYSVYRLLGDNNRRYFHYLLRTEIYKAEYKRRSSGVIESRLRLYTDDFFDIRSLLPPVEVQVAIANFLDQKTAQIDEAIAIKEQQITLLKERKQIIIQQAVTQGLNPDAPTKDSGVDWIWMIPAHWEIPKLKLICSFVLDGTHGSYPRVEEGYRLLSVRNIIDNKFVFRDDDSRVSYRHFKEISSKFKVSEGDIQLAIVGATLGKVALVDKMPEDIVTQRSVSTIRVKKTKISNRFVAYFMRSEVFQSYLWNNAGFSAQPGVYLNTIQNAYIPLPSLSEQIEIVDYIESKLIRIDDAIALQYTQIETLKEYKATLINSAVTGKIKVV